MIVEYNSSCYRDLVSCDDGSSHGSAHCSGIFRVYRDICISIFSYAKLPDLYPSISKNRIQIKFIRKKNRLPLRKKGNFHLKD